MPVSEQWGVADPVRLGRLGRVAELGVEEVGRRAHQDLRRAALRDGAARTAAAARGDAESRRARERRDAEEPGCLEHRVSPSSNGSSTAIVDPLYEWTMRNRD